jgi:type I restriction enzyme S subunit
MSLAHSKSPAAEQILAEVGFTSIPEGWSIVRIEELLSQDRGISVGVMYPGPHDPLGIPLIKAGDLANNRITPHPEYRISKEKHYEYRRTEFSGGEILLSLVGDIGRCAIVPAEMAGWNSARATAVIRLTDLSDAPYVRLCFLSSPIQHLMGAWATTTVQATLNLKEIKQIPIPWPPKATRDRIANVAGTLDDKIELNRRMNETLETMARRLFRSWFVDFDPVHAKATLRRQHPKLTNADLSRRALPNMAPEIAELFPDSFEESTLGPIPKGWSAGKVPDSIEINPTRSLAKGTMAPWLEMANMPTRSARALAWEHREFGSGTKFINGDTLVARITPCLENGKTAFVDFLGEGQVGAGSTEYIVLRPRAPLPPVFAYLLARTDDFRQHLITNMTGTSGRQRAPADCLNTFPLVTPPKEVAESFARVTGDLFAQMKTIDEESLALTATRDKLLPRLLSGELDVTDNGGADEST